MAAPDPIPHLVSVPNVDVPDVGVPDVSGSGDAGEKGAVGDAPASGQREPVHPPYLRAVISAAFFFLPFGLVALYFSWRTDRALQHGDTAENKDRSAIRYERLAKRWSLIAFLTGGAIYGFLIAAFLMLGAFSS